MYRQAGQRPRCPEQPDGGRDRGPVESSSRANRGTPGSAARRKVRLISEDGFEKRYEAAPYTGAAIGSTVPTDYTVFIIGHCARGERFAWIQRDQLRLLLSRRKQLFVSF